MCESRISAGAIAKVTGLGKASRENSGVVVRHGGTCSRCALSETVN